MKKYIITVALGLVGGMIGFYLLNQLEQPNQQIGDSLTSNTQSLVQAPVIQTGADFSGSTLDFTHAAEKSIDAVVHVKTEFTIEKQPHPFSYFFNADPKPRQYKARSSGSGVIISEDGYIVTNNHVVDNATRVAVTLNNNRTYEAKVIGSDPATDLAVLRLVDERKFAYLDYANSDNVRVGEWVLAVGNPYSLTSTVTAGIISAKSRNLNILQYDPSKDVFPIESFLQTDAAVNPGNSGGALVNTKGELIGINTAIASTTGSYTGYSFAVPVNIVAKVVADIIEFGKVQRAFLGVSVREIDEELADKKNLEEVTGLKISEVHDVGGAKEAGLKKNDLILKIGSIKVGNIPEFQEQMSKFRPGDSIAITIMRDGKELVKQVVLKNKDGKTDLTPINDKSYLTFFGADLGNPEPYELKSLNLKSGVKVTQVNPGAFRQLGVREGFIITKVDKTEVKSLNHLEEILSKKKGGILIEGYYPNGKRAYYGLGI